MSLITLIGNANPDLEIDPDPVSLFSKYVLGRNKIGASSDGAAKSLSDLQSQSISLSFDAPVPLGKGAEQLSITPKASGSIALSQPKTLFDKELYDNVALPTGQNYVSTSFKASVAPKFTDAVDGLKFGFSANSDCTLTSSHPVAPGNDLLANIAIGLKSFNIPADLDDIKAMQPSSVASVEGNGSIKFTVNVNAPINPYPLAAIPTGIADVGVKVSAGAKLGVQIAAALSGSYKVQVTKVDNDNVLLAYSAKRGEDLTVTCAESVGVSASVDGTDIVQELLGAVIPDAKLPENHLKNLNIAPDEIKTISDAIKAGCQKSFAAALQEQWNESADRATAFLYRIKLSALDDNSRTAVSNALRCDLSMMESEKMLAGITPVRSIVNKARESSRGLNLNLFGILNAGSLHDYLQTTKWIADSDTGDLTIIDTASASDVGYQVDNIAKDSQRLRQVIADAGIATCTYKASKTGYQPDIATRFWAFELNETGTAASLASYLNVAQALKLIDRETAETTSAAAHLPLDRTIFQAELKLDDSLSEKLFLDESGQARQKSEYEEIGRAAMVATLPADLKPEIVAARTRALTDPALWKQMADGGSAQAITNALEPLFGNSASFNNIAQDVWGDYVLIEWWANAISNLAKSLQAVREYLDTQAVTNAEDGTLSKLRDAVNKRLKSALTNAHDRFHQPWGLVVMDLASGQTGAATLTISSPGYTVALARKQTAAALTANP